MSTNWFDQSYPPSVLNPPPPVIPATGATAGTPGAWTPAGAQAPAQLAEANALGYAGPAWTAGQWIDLAGGGDAYWNGTAFVAGVAPVVEEDTTTSASPKRRRKADDES